MDLDELRDVCRAERQRDSLQHLQESFYRDVAAYIADLKTERERAAEAADDPFSAPEVRRLTDEIESAEKLVESIYKRRVGKVIERASFAADGTTHDDEGLTDEERDLFDDLVARIERNRERVLDAVDPAAADAAPDADAVVQSDAPEADADRGREAGPPSDGGDAPDPSDLLSEAMGGADGSPPAGESAPDPPGATADVDAGADAEGDANAGGPPTADGGAPAAPAGTGEAPDPPAPTPGAAAADGPAPERTRNGAGAPDGTDTADRGVGDAPDRRTVYVTRDVGEIYGADGRTYRLLSEDVVDLPADNAQALVERDAAEPLGGGAG